MKRSIGLLALTLLSATGCATMHHGSWEKIGVESNPPGAFVAVDCGEAAHHPRGVTPMVVSVPRAETQCRLRISKEGYETRTVRLSRHVAPEAKGNFGGVRAGAEIFSDSIFCCDEDSAFVGAVTMLGGAIYGGVGLAVDRATGAMFEHHPQTVIVRLHREGEPPEAITPKSTPDSDDESDDDDADADQDEPVKSIARNAP